MSHNTKYYRKKLKKTESSKKNRCAFSSASISIREFCKYHPQTDRKSRSIGRNCRIVCFHKKLSVDIRWCTFSVWWHSFKSWQQRWQSIVWWVPEHPQQMVNQIVNQISDFAYESVKSKKLNKRSTWYFCFYYRMCFSPILYKTTRKFPILGVRSCSQNAEKKPWKLKVFYKGYFRQNKGCFIEILTKIKSKLMSNFLVILLDPNL